MQEQIELTLPVTGQKVILRGYVTGSIDAELQRIMLKAYEYEVGFTPKNEEDVQTMAGSQVKAKVSPTAQLDADRRAIELMVISVNGQTEKVADLVYALPKGDTDAVKARISEINDASKVTPEQKKTSSVNISQP